MRDSKRCVTSPQKTGGPTLAALSSSQGWEPSTLAGDSSSSDLLSARPARASQTSAPDPGHLPDVGGVGNSVRSATLTIGIDT
jgi:hypothetical protein